MNIRLENTFKSKIKNRRSHPTSKDGDFPANCRKMPLISIYDQSSIASPNISEVSPLSMCSTYHCVAPGMSALEETIKAVLASEDRCSPTPVDWNSAFKGHKAMRISHKECHAAITILQNSSGRG